MNKVEAFKNYNNNESKLHFQLEVSVAIVKANLEAFETSANSSLILA
jgi:hypothetical protein